MKQKLLLATAVAAILAFSSCKKDDPGTAAPYNPGTSRQLKKVTKTENGTVTVYNLTYDASNRLLSYKSTDNSKSIQFAYDAAGNLAGIEQREDNEFKNIYTYTYINNVPVSGTFKSWELTAGEPDALTEDNKLTYTVTNNKVSKIKMEMLQDGGSELNLLLTYSNDNLTKLTSEGVNIFTANFTFGNKKAVFPKVTNWVLDQAGLSLQFAVKNEMLTASYDFPGSGDDLSVNTTYTYDSNGYVLTSNDGDTQLTFEYQ